MKIYWRSRQRMKISAPEQIISAIKNGHIVVTASRRQQRFVHELWDQHKTETESHLKVWDDANSIAWDEWIMQLYEALTLLDCFATNQQKSPRILTPSAQKWLFKNIIVQQFTEYSTWSSVQQESLINNIYQAWISYNGWLLDTEDDEIKNNFFETEETRLFRNVVLKHQLICSEKNWLPRENVVNYLLKKLNFFNKIIKCNISFYGFSVFTPQQSYFISKLEKNIFDFNMNEIEFSETSENYDRENLIPCVSTESEWKEAARWARDTAEKNPQSAIAVVIPELASQRNKIFRIFQREFQPQLQLQAEKSLPLGFNFSAGEPFSQLAVINSLKSWLGVLTNGHIDHWQAVLEDSFCRGAEVEKWARYQLSKNLTKLNVEYMTLNKFKQFLLTCNIIPLGQWLDIIQLLVEKIENNQTKKYPTQWH